MPHLCPVSSRSGPPQSFIYAYFDSSTCCPTLAGNRFFLRFLPSSPLPSFFFSFFIPRHHPPSTPSCTVPAGPFSLSFSTSSLNNCEPAACYFFFFLLRHTRQKAVKTTLCVATPDPFPVLLFLKGTPRVLSFWHMMNRPRTSPPPPSPLFLIPLSACLYPHPAPLWCTLCVSAFTVFTSIIQHLSTRSLSPSLFLPFPPFSSLFPTPRSSCLLPPSLPPCLSLILNKKSLLIARNLWDSAPHRLTFNFFSIYFYICVSTRFSSLRVLSLGINFVSASVFIITSLQIYASLYRCL